MKKTILSLALLAISVLCVFAYKQYKNHYTDNIPPILNVDSDTITANVKVTEEELLAGVSAKDDRSGDVTDTIVIENISNFISENTRIITYAAIDENMNVGRIERTLVYTDYSEPLFKLSAPLSFVVGSKVDVLKNVTASSKLDGDLTQKVRYGLDNIIDNMTVGTYPVEFRVTDSCGKTSYLNTDIEIHDSNYAGIDVTLSNYLTYIKTGTKFDPKKYYKGSSIEGELSIVSNVNTKEAGTYYVDYFVNGINTSGKSRLVVVVS